MRDDSQNDAGARTYAALHSLGSGAVDDPLAAGRLIKTGEDKLRLLGSKLASKLAVQERVHGVPFGRSG